MSVVAYVPSFILTILFCLLVPWGADFWLTVDTIITSVFGFVIIFFPRHFLNHQGVSIYVATRIYSYMFMRETISWNTHALVFGIYGDCLWLLGNVIYVFKTSGETRPAIGHNRHDWYIKSDFIQTVLFGLSFYAMPTVMLGFQTTKKLDSLHETLVRMMAAFVFNTGIISYYSLHFSSRKAKIWHLVSRIVGCLGLLSAQIYSQLTTTSWTRWHIFFGMMGMTEWALNSVFGLFSMKRDTTEQKERSCNTKNLTNQGQKQNGNDKQE